MEGVLTGLALMWIVIGVGMVIGRLGILGDYAQDVLTRFVYWIASPALLFSTISQTDIRAIVGPALGVEAISAVTAALTYVLISVVFLRGSRVETTVGAMTSSLSNAAYLGIPLSTYILGSPTHVVPVLIFQLGLLTPAFFVLTDLAAGRSEASAVNAVRLIFTNPMLIASMLGLLVSLSGVGVPELVTGPVEVLAGAAVPCILVSFGISLLETGVKGFRDHAPEITTSTVIKLIAQPLFAYLAGRFVFGLDGFELFAVTSMGGLPTAQNAYVAAFRAGAGNELARGTVVATTVFVTPTLLGIAALLS
ncbi:MAG TPA: AEC family transporter [Actinomycetaceae bacterium]|nr:AEC family transporter [Actinomycetaceae bacterium]